MNWSLQIRLKAYLAFSNAQFLGPFGCLSLESYVVLAPSIFSAVHFEVPLLVSSGID